MISSLGDFTDSSFLVCRFYVGRRLSTLRSEWRPLLSNLVPNAVLPNAVLPSKFYSECISVVSSLRLANEDFNSKILYKLLLSKESSPPLLSGHWTPVLGPSYLHVIGLASEMIFVRILKMIFFG